MSERTIETTVVFSNVMPEDVTLKLNIQGGGQARFVVNGDPKSWTSNSMSVGAKEGDSVDIEVQSDSGYQFERYDGKTPPYTVTDQPPYYE